MLKKIKNVRNDIYAIIGNDTKLRTPFENQLGEKLFKENSDISVEELYDKVYKYIEKLIGSARSIIRRQQFEKLLEVMVAIKNEEPKSKVKKDEPKKAVSRSDIALRGAKEEPKQKVSRSEMLLKSKSTKKEEPKPVAKPAAKSVDKKVAKKEESKPTSKLATKKEDSKLDEIKLVGYVLKSRNLSSVFKNVLRSATYKQFVSTVNLEDSRDYFSVHISKEKTLKELLNMSLIDILNHEIFLHNKKLKKYIFKDEQFIYLKRQFKLDVVKIDNMMLKFSDDIFDNISKTDFFTRAQNKYTLLKFILENDTISSTKIKDLDLDNILGKFMIIPLLAINEHYNKVCNTKEYLESNINSKDYFEVSGVDVITDLVIKEKKTDNTVPMISDDDYLEDLVINMNTKIIIVSNKVGTHSLDITNNNFKTVKKLLDKVLKSNKKDEKIELLKEVFAICDPKERLLKTLSDALNVNLSIVNNTLSINNTILKGPQIIDLCMFLQENDTLNSLSLVNFFKRVSKNPFQHAREELYDFIIKNKMKITPVGTFLAYRSMTETYVDGFTGTMLNFPGFTTHLALDNCDTNSRNLCSNGLHICTPSYGMYSHKLSIVEIDPAEVVSVPREYKSSKMRVRSFKMLFEISELQKKFGFIDFLGKIKRVSHIPELLSYEINKAVNGKAQLDLSHLNWNKYIQEKNKSFLEKHKNKILASTTKEISKGYVEKKQFKVPSEQKEFDAYYKMMKGLETNGKFKESEATVRKLLKQFDLVNYQILEHLDEIGIKSPINKLETILCTYASIIYENIPQASGASININAKVKIIAEQD